MALALYRRHRKECEGGHAEDSRSGEFEEGRRGWKKCGCLIHVSGTSRAAKFSRKQTGKVRTGMKPRQCARLEKPNEWGRRRRSSKPPRLRLEAGGVRSERLTVDRAIQAWGAKVSKKSAAANAKKTRLLWEKLRRFSESKGYVLLEQWGPTRSRGFRMLMAW